ncbi:probable LRR receptor-like serine/threonine-protein kinase At1g05700 [Cornus florida]|uniref:probable LRR receptor-like serine/threonine-protein kinase At1g05700 n=1 Tax=Cornus florida TaxID=4283 RepID=UPI0028999EB4|nr:probable LRR receptor-like serine/threonine-protein kinase At1g05700 [Cornus florida]
MGVSFILFCCCLALTLPVHGQDQSGFISIDCGIPPQGSNYTDKTTGIRYTSDAGFVDTGESKAISSAVRNNYILEQQLFNVRSFPKGARNCYGLRPEGGRGNKYLIRASFLYGNYDGKNQPPQFDLHIGVDYWDTVLLENSFSIWTNEIIHVPSTDYIYVCLVNIDTGTPFISTLELRPLNILMYPTTNGSSLSYFRRYDLGSTADKYQVVRYKDDVYDRMWKSKNLDYLWKLNTTKTIDSNGDGHGLLQPPSKVMSTAAFPNISYDSLLFSWEPDSPSDDQFYIYLYFAEVEVLKANETREFYIYLNDQLFYDDPVVPQYLSTFPVYRDFPHESSDGNFELSLRKTSTSTHPPILNAIELYTAIQLHSQTDDIDVQAMMSIKSVYGLTRNWQGDPCVPQSYVWKGLNCSDNGARPARIISLDLSSSGLNGEIAPYISSLTMIQSLDLSNNSLTGQVPGFLSRLTFLKLLNLKGNNFTGSIPAELLAKSKDGSLSLSIDEIEGENTNPCQSIPCEKKKKSIVVPVVASAAALCLLLTTATMATLWFIKRRKRVVRKEEDAETNQKDRSFEMKNRQLTYSEVLSITNNFQRVIGKGGFGTVYHGYLGNSQVAVKMLSLSSVQGYKEFQAEADLLSCVRHKNLTSLVGYCKEGTNIGIIYEYMVNGNLRRHLQADRNSIVLSWEERIRIAMDAAQGLEYLHHGCKPPIIHRDVKSTNILLNENFQAKLSDFGLSKAFPTEGGSHVSTIVAGTPGYLDPEYCASNRLNEKSDVYSFGIVLMEIITSRPPILRDDENIHIIDWVSSNLANGDIKSVVDPRLQGDFDINCVWKAVELAMTCVSGNSTQRPNMNFVVTELRGCLPTEIARHGTESIDSVGVPLYLESKMSLPMMR